MTQGQTLLHISLLRVACLRRSHHYLGRRFQIFKKTQGRLTGSLKWRRIITISSPVPGLEDKNKSNLLRLIQRIRVSLRKTGLTLGRDMTCDNICGKTTRKEQQRQKRWYKQCWEDGFGHAALLHFAELQSGPGTHRNMEQSVALAGLQLYFYIICSI